MDVLTGGPSEGPHTSTMIAKKIPPTVHATPSSRPTLGPSGDRSATRRPRVTTTTAHRASEEAQARAVRPPWNPATLGPMCSGVAPENHASASWSCGVPPDHW